MTKHFSAEQHRAWLASLPRKIIAVKALITSPQGHVLLVKPDYEDIWQFPGGGVEAKETPINAILRELREELGFVLQKEQLALIGSAFDDENDSIILIYSYALPVEESQRFTLQPDEIEGCAFFRKDELAQRLSHHYGEFLATYKG